MEHPHDPISDSRQPDQLVNPPDEPPWSPSLIEVTQEKRHGYVVAEVEDSQRINTYGPLTLAVPPVEILTLDILKPVRLTEVLQRAGDQATVFGEVVMIDGDPGLGKSLLMVQYAASLSRG